MADHDSRLQAAISYAGDIGVLGVLEALGRLRGLILLPVIARTLGVGAYGAWTQSLLFASLGSSVVGMQLYMALVRFVAGTSDRDEQRAYFLPLLLVVAGLGTLSALTTALAPTATASIVLGDARFVAIGRLLGLWVGLTAVGQLGVNMLRALQRVRLFGLLQTGQTLVQLALVAGIVLRSGDLTAAVLGAIGLEFVYVVVVLVLAVRPIGLAWPGFGKLRPSLAFSLPLIPSYYAGAALNFADRLLIASLLGAEAVGVYAAGYSVARVIREIYKPIRTALLPAISGLWDRGERAEARWLLANTTRYFLLLAIPAWAALAALGPTVVRLLAEGVHRSELTTIIGFIGFGFLATNLQLILGVLLQLLQRTQELALSKVVSAALYVGLVALAVPRWGLVGGAVASALGYLLDLAITFSLAWRRERFDLPFRAALKSVLATMVMTPVVLYVNRGGALSLALSMVAGLAAYLILMVAMRGVDRRELAFLQAAARILGPFSEGSDSSQAERSR